MSVDFKTSETKVNLMRAFAGESQARNRYTFAAEKVRGELYAVSAVFVFTAEQERAHAKVFGGYLEREMSGNVMIDAGYPTDPKEGALALLRVAQHNEYEEYSDAYKNFGDIAEREGFFDIAASFRAIAQIEKIHSERFGKLAELLEKDKLFVSDTEVEWMCLNCGFVHRGKLAPPSCPVCGHERGYFIRYSLAPFTESEG